MSWSWSIMRRSLLPARFLLSSPFQLPNPSSEPKLNRSPSHPTPSIHDIWLASRSTPDGSRLVAGAQRPLTRRNMELAFLLLRGDVLNFMIFLWSCQPMRTTLLMVLNLMRSLFPAFRGYSQALIIDEIQSLVTSGIFTWSRLLRLIATEVLRRVLESSLNQWTAANENLVLGEAKFLIERHQIELRVRLDGPTLADQEVQELLHESDLFSRSFHGGGFGSISPFDFIQILTHFAEIFSHLLLMLSLTRSLTHFCVLVLSIVSVSLPLFMPNLRTSLDGTESLFSAEEAKAAQTIEKLRSMAYNEAYRPEVHLFGMGGWLVDSWSTAWKFIFDSNGGYPVEGNSFLSDANVADFLTAFQNIPLIFLLRTSSASLGSLTLYRSSIQSVILSFRSLLATIRMAFQAIFLMSAFCASKALKPKMQPSEHEAVEYRSIDGGMSIHVRGLSYTYPGSAEPALRDVNLTLKEGETLAIVGYNGSGKSTLAKILLRIIDFDKGELNINGIDIRRYNPTEYHRHVTAVFQNFSKFNFTLHENIGLGDSKKLQNSTAIDHALKLAEAKHVVDSLPQGLQTVLESPGFDSIGHFPRSLPSTSGHHGLSGGEWQRVAIARAFMRAEDPSTHLLVFDEPTSSLDAQAQNRIFDTIYQLSHTSDGTRTKTVVFITHRLSTARRADKVAMMENGTITEFGTHEELLRRNGSYAALYQQSV